MSTDLDVLTAAAEAEWLDRWTDGPSEVEMRLRPEGEAAPDVVLLDDTGAQRALSEWWQEGPALLIFWRHFGCYCGLGRAERLRNEWDRYRESGLHPVVIGQGEPLRAAAYRADQALPCRVLCDPNYDVYRSYGVGHWSIERLLSTSSPEYWDHPRELGVSFQNDRRASGLPLVDDPWRASAEFVVGVSGVIRHAFAYQYCFDYPPPEVLTTAAALSGSRRSPGPESAPRTFGGR